jgi:hypothetical protein
MTTRNTTLLDGQEGQIRLLVHHPHRFVMDYGTLMRVTCHIGLISVPAMRCFCRKFLL